MTTGPPLRATGPPRVIDSLDYVDAAPRGGIERERLDVLALAIHGLPPGLDALVACSDLQGREIVSGGTGRLLGEIVPDRLASLAASGRIPPCDRTGVLIAGDLYVVPDLSRRGGLGDVRPVWRAFAGRFRWVAGVSGNHDSFGGDDAFLEFCSLPRIYWLDGDTVTLDGLIVGGVAGIIRGDRWPQEQDEPTFTQRLGRVLALKPSLIVLHQPPDGYFADRRGHAAVTHALEHASFDGLVVAGHRHWPEIACDLGSFQVLNAHERVLVLTRATQSPS